MKERALTRGLGSETKRMTKADATSRASRPTMSAVSGHGIRPASVVVTTTVPMSSLSASGSRNEPASDDWLGNLRAIQPSNCPVQSLFGQR